jgi:hypothetical protein
LIARVERWDDVPPPCWDDAVQRLGGTAFHTAGWAEYQHASRGARPVFLLARDGAGRECGAALALVHCPSWTLPGVRRGDLVVPTHPVARDGDPGATAALLAQCEAVGRSRGCTRLRLDSFMSGGSPVVPAARGYAEHERVEFCVDLTRDLATLWEGLHRKQRERVRHLRRAGVTLDSATGPEDLSRLRAAREATRGRRAERGQGYEPSPDALYEHLDRYLVKRGMGRLFVARAGDEAVAAIFFMTFAGRACSIFSGSTEQGYRLGAQSGLYWAAVETFKAEGLVELNRGGVPAAAAAAAHPLNGIYQFKARLGATPRRCRSGEKVLSPFRHRVRRLAAMLVAGAPGPGKWGRRWA